MQAETPEITDPIQLKRVGRELAAPFTLDMPDDEPLRALEIYRHLPGRRLTFRARWGRKQVVAKLFFRRREYRRDREGLEALQGNGIPTPAVLCHLVDRRRRVFLMVSEYLDQPLSLEAACHQGEPAAAVELLRKAVALIGRGHRAGLVQTDIHLDNFLLHGDDLYLIDGGGIQAAGQVSVVERTRNLALFFAQLTPDFDSLLPEVLEAYGDGAPALDSLRRTTLLRREERIRDYQGKTLRTCSEFVATRSWFKKTVIRRDCLGGEVEQQLADPEAAMGGGRVLKSGNTATVARVGDQVIKRYNIKDWQHALDRCWRPSRARASWCNGLRLRLLGIATPRPLALQENRFGPLWRGGYLICDHIAGDDLLAWVERHQQVPPWIGGEVRRLFDILWSARVGHGDMKATNLIVAGDRLVLLDLDAMAYYARPGRFRAAHRKDLGRFIDNWRGEPRRHFIELLQPCLDRVGLQPGNEPKDIT